MLRPAAPRRGSEIRRRALRHLERQTLPRRPRLVLDDVLRQTVGFSIFRRSSSRNANPTTQGVSLRGLGASGASRSVILFDGVPLNDPFGGWVQWGRVAADRGRAGRGAPRRRIEPLWRRGFERCGKCYAAYDARAGGSAAICLAARKGRWRAPAHGGFTYGKWLTSLTAASFHTRGFKPVDEAARGPVDSYAGVRSNNFAGRITRDLGEYGTGVLSPVILWRGPHKRHGPADKPDAYQAICFGRRSWWTAVRPAARARLTVCDCIWRSFRRDAGL